ncbi:MAG: hypothetical protein J6P20_00630 [Oscillospiraceae bacterium]|nr:hypothetical protein [Oscillospiraceae bacterium]
MVAVRFFSKSGNTRQIAEAIAEGAGVRAVSITEEPTLTQRTDILFLGGAPYANIMAPELRAYAGKLSPELACRVILFTTSNWSQRTVLALKKQLREKGIRVEDAYFYAHMLRIRSRLDAAKEFGRKFSTEKERGRIA